MIYHSDDNSDTHSPQGLKPQHSAVALSPPGALRGARWAPFLWCNNKKYTNFKNWGIMTYSIMLVWGILHNDLVFTHIYYKISTICLFHHTHKFFFLVMRTYKNYSLSKFQTCNTVLTIVTMLYIASPWLTYFIIGILNLLTPFTHFIPPCFWQPPICSIYDRLVFFKPPHWKSYSICLSLTYFI